MSWSSASRVSTSSPYPVPATVRPRAAGRSTPSRREQCRRRHGLRSLPAPRGKDRQPVHSRPGCPIDASRRSPPSTYTPEGARARFGISGASLLLHALLILVRRLPVAAAGCFLQHCSARELTGTIRVSPSFRLPPGLQSAYSRRGLAPGQPYPCRLGDSERSRTAGGSRHCVSSST